jgi:hypothetical protein
VTDLIGHDPPRAGGGELPLLVGEPGEHIVERLLLTGEVDHDVDSEAFGAVAPHRGGPYQSSVTSIPVGLDTVRL